MYTILVATDARAGRHFVEAHQNPQLVLRQTQSQSRGLESSTKDMGVFDGGRKSGAHASNIEDLRSLVSTICVAKVDKE